MTKLFNPHNQDNRKHWLIQMLIGLIIVLLLSTQIEAQENALVILTVADIATTGYIIGTGGQEFNLLLPKDNIPAIAVIKMIILIGYLKTEPSKKELWFMNFITSVMVVNNLNQIIKHR